MRPLFAEIPRAVDPALPIGSFFALMFVAYYLGTVPGNFSFPWTEIFWVGSLGWAILRIKSTAWVAANAFYLTLLLLFLVSIAANINWNAGFEYTRAIATGCVMSTILLGLMRGEARHFLNRDLETAIHIWGHRLASIALLVWAVISVQTIQNLGIIDPREVTGEGYLTLSDIAALFALASLCRRDIKLFDYLLIGGTSTIAISFIGSRATMALLGALLLVGIYFRFPVGVRLIGIIAAALLSYYAYFLLIEGNDQAFYRLSTLLNFSDEDASLLYRESLSDAFWTDIKQDSLCAVFGCHPPIGDYIHNALSLFQYFGIISAFLVILFVSVIVSNYRVILNSRWLMFFLYSVTLFTFARAWMAIPFPVVVTLVLQLILRWFSRVSLQGPGVLPKHGNQSAP